MVIKVYISQISASNETKKRQQRALLILQSHNIDYEIIDVTEAGHEKDKDMIQSICKKRNSQPVLPPQFFNDDAYCGDYEDFDAANDEDKLKSLLKLEEAVEEDGANGSGGGDQHT